MPITLELLREEFPTAWELLLKCDPDFSSGEFSLYDWQIEILNSFSDPEITKEKPFSGTVVAANGSGKDKVLIAPAALWLAITNQHALSIITTASGQQLDRQTDRYIRVLAARVNQHFGEEVVTINYRRYVVKALESSIELFVTDEAGRAEGWHPTTSAAKFGIFVSEAKTVPNEIFDALHRCRGNSHRLDVSSPGPPIGYFYDTASDPTWSHWKVTAFQCPHITPDEIEKTRRQYGEHSPFYLSSVLAEFATTDEPVVIPRHFVTRLKNFLIPKLSTTHNIAGLDLALSGGAESVLAVVNGNAVIAFEAFKIPEETKLISHLEDLFYRFNLHLPGSSIHADAGGLGKPILQHLANRGWKNIRFFYNQSTPSDVLAYENLGTELWFNLKNLIENYQIIIPYEDEVLVKQLTSRFYTWAERTKKHQIESKLKMRARGLPSPDRADALTLAFAELHYEEREENKPKNIPDFGYLAPKPSVALVSKLASLEKEQKLNIPFVGTDTAMSGARKLPDHLREELKDIYGRN